MRYRLIGMVFAMAMLFIAAEALALAGQERQPRRPASRQLRGDATQVLGPFARQLDLTEQQRAEISELVKAERDVTQSLGKEMAAARRALRELTDSGVFDEYQVRGLAQEQGRITAELLVARERLKSNVLNVLTQEQRDKLTQLREAAETRMRERESRRQQERTPRRERPRRQEL